jgi:hypothetical protein
MVLKVFKFDCIHYFLLASKVQLEKEKKWQPIKAHKPLDLWQPAQENTVLPRKPIHFGH